VDWIAIAPFAVVLVLLVALLVTVRPVGAALGIYALLLPFDSVMIPAEVGGIHLHFTWFVGAAAACILFGYGALRLQFTAPPRSFLWLALLVAWASISPLWAINLSDAAYRQPVLVLLLIIYLAAVAIHVDKKDVDTIASLAVLGGCIAAGISLYRLYTGQWYTRANAHAYELAGRGSLWGTDPNHVGASLILPLCLAVGYMLTVRTGFKRFLSLGAVLLITAGICSTMSRGALLASLVAVLVIIWRSGAGRRALWIISALGSIALLMPTFFFSRIGDTVKDQGAGRLYIWGVGLRALKHYVLLGAGLDCFPDAYKQFAQTGIYYVGPARAPHNIYLGTSVELGVVGLVLLLLVIREHVSLASAVRKAMPDALSRMQVIPYEAAFYGLLINGFFLGLEWETYFWLALTLLAVASRCRQESREPAPAEVRHYYTFGLKPY
jgi:O-antigen ligase